MNQTEMNVIHPGGFAKAFAKYVSFNILSMIGMSVYILADTFFIANSVGSGGLTALNLVLPVYSLVNGTGLLLGMGGATRFAILRGEGRNEEAARMFPLSLALGLGAGIFFTAAGIFFAPGIARLLGASDDILPLASDYLRTLLSFSCAFILNDILNGFLRNDGSPRLSMSAMLAGSLCNIVFDYLFLFPLDMGMSGAALATGFAPLLGMAIGSLHFRKGRSHFQLGFRGGIQLAGTGRILALGLPSLITELSSGIVILFFNLVILRLNGSLGVAAYGVIANLALIVSAIFTGVAQGIQPLASTYYGARDKVHLTKLRNASLILAVLLGAACCLAGELMPEAMASIFNKDGGARLTELARDGIRIYFLAFPLMGINIAASSLLAAAEQPVSSFAVSFLRGCGAVIPLVLVLPILWGMTGVWLVVPLAEAVTLTVSFTGLARLARRGAVPA